MENRKRGCDGGGESGDIMRSVGQRGVQLLGLPSDFGGLMSGILRFLPVLLPSPLFCFLCSHFFFTNQTSSLFLFKCSHSHPFFYPILYSTVNTKLN